MSAYRNALRQKKFEGLQATPEPYSQEEVDQMASVGDMAPEITDDPEMELQPEMAALGEMDSEQLPISDAEGMEFVQDAQATPGIQDMTSEEVFGVSAPMGPPKSLRDRVQQSLKKRKL